ncbi:PAS domain S-box-containing protein [Halogranum amylolyticum]|uniref:PAS domain S-box-containing protein n=1 Tax=Halogranum amylolyticum TaxID=660520 RepID=A0A1H8URK9_9EURY|nr:bacterio-opsin activator domain-containing protein [Halogranum amylolyticum]SEP05653.1 PAS domain S-box-containing protein [Halogranum amylolyticum]
MNGVLLTSIVLRLVGVGYSLVLLRRSGDRRFGFLTVLLTFMTVRQLLTAASTATTGLEEVPGLVVSGLAFLTIHYLDRYVDEERRLTRKLQSANDELCTFKKAVEHAGHAIFFTDPDGTITYANPSIEAVTGYSPEEVVGENPRLWKSGEHQTAYYEEMWETISRGDVWDGEIVNQDASGEQHWVDMTIAPVTNDGEIEQFVAVDSDVTERKRQQRRIERQNERLVRLNRMNQLLRDVNRRLVTATNRDDVERTVVDRLVNDAQVVAAGIVDRTASGRLRTRYVAGETDVVDGLLDDAADELAVVTAAVDHGQTSVSTSLSSLDGVETTADTVGVVPLTFRNSRYGALVVATRTPEFFETISSEVRAELGDTIGSAINAADRRRELVDDRITELTFAVNDTSAPLFALARESERDVELVRTTAGRESKRVLFVRIHDVDGETAHEAVAAVADLDDPTVVSETESECVIRVVATGTETLADTLATHGATIGELTVAAATLDGELVVDVPTGVDVRPIVETLRTRFEVCDLVGRRERERTVDTAVGFREELEAVLTDRQLEAIRIAHLAGYFEWPREHSGEEVASMMDVCQSTYMQHLRAAERKLAAQLFDSDTMGRRLAPGSAVG